MIEELTNDVSLIINQTNYTKEEAIENLNRLKDPILVIKEYLNINTATTINSNNNCNNSNNSSNISINQKIYKEIREKLYYDKRIN